MLESSSVSRDTILDLRALGVFLAKAKRTDVGTESRFAYKAIDFVLSQELDLVETGTPPKDRPQL